MNSQSSFIFSFITKSHLSNLNLVSLFNVTNLNPFLSLDLRHK